MRQGLRITQEVTAGVYPTSPAPGTFTNLRVTNPVPDQPKPIIWNIRDAAGSGRRVQTGSDQNETAIGITTPLFFSQAKLLLPGFCTPSASGLPGLTTYTIDQFHAMEDNSATKFYTRMLGCTPQSMKLTINNSGDGVIAMITMQFVGRSWNHTITSTDYPTPALTDFPTDPVHLKHLAGGLVVGSSTSAFKNFSIEVKNVLDVIYDENANPTPQFYGNRDVDWMVDLRFLSAALRTDYEAVTAKTVSFTLTDGTNSIVFNLQGANYLDDLGLTLPLDKAFYVNDKGHSNIDHATGTEMVLTITP